MEAKLTKNIKRTFMGEKFTYSKGTIAYVDGEVDDENNEYWMLEFDNGYAFKVKKNDFELLPDE